MHADYVRNFLDNTRDESMEHPQPIVTMEVLSEGMQWKFRLALWASMVLLVVGGIAPVAEQYGFAYIGGHPMAGKERGGFTSATDDLYVGASMILTPDKRTDMQLLEMLKAFFLDIGFASLTFSTPDEHDRIIAFTSQLAHIVSSAYVKSPEAQRRRGFSAGSFQDMTRVARLDENMWTELFLDDADYLTTELDEIIRHLTEYQDALKARDAQKLHDLLKDGREKKASAGGH